MNSELSVASQIRTNCAEILTKKIPLDRMHYYLMDLFQDRTKIDTSIFGRFTDEDSKKHEKYTDCWKINCGFESKSNHNLFIPFDDGGNK